MFRSALRQIREILMTRQAYRFFLQDWTHLTDLKLVAQLLETQRFSCNLRPVELNRPSATRILVVAAHPDDELLGPGGTLLHAVDAGAQVTVLFVTPEDPDNERIREARTAARSCGFSAEFLWAPIGAIDVGAETAKAFAAKIDAVQPQAMFLPAVFDDHDDHRRISELLLSAAEFLSAEPEIWGYQVYTTLPGNVVVDISDVSERKRAGIRHYKSQLVSRDWAHFALGLNAFNLRHLSNTGGQPRYAECFWVVPLKEYLTLCGPYFEDPSMAYYGEAYKSPKLPTGQ